MPKHRKSKRKNRKSQDSFYLLTLGCPKNVVDSEGISEMLLEADYEATADPGQADVMIVTGERTMLEYLFRPISGSFNRALREE